MITTILFAVYTVSRLPFQVGLSCAHRCDNLFKDLDSRALTSAEQDIIAQRVALQRRMLEEYEKREKARKVLLSCSTVKCTSLRVRDFASPTVASYKHVGMLLEASDSPAGEGAESSLS